jgi:hypothetical protein
MSRPFVTLWQLKNDSRGTVVTGGRKRGFVTARGSFFGGALDLHLLWMAADREEGLHEHIPQPLLTHVVFSNVSHVESNNNLSPQLIYTT